MFMKKQILKRTPKEKEKIILEAQTLGMTATLRRHGVSRSLFYDWLDKYTASGIEGLEDRRGKNMDAHIQRLEKENKALKELLAEKELESKLKDELLKKKFGQWSKKGK